MTKDQGPKRGFVPLAVGSTVLGGCTHAGNGHGFHLDAHDDRRYRPAHTSQPSPFGSVRPVRISHPGSEPGVGETTHAATTRGSSREAGPSVGNTRFGGCA